MFQYKYTMTYKEKIKMYITKFLFFVLFLSLGVFAGFYIVLKGYFDKPYTYIYRITNSKTDASEYKFSPILKEEKKHNEKGNK